MKSGQTLAHYTIIRQLGKGGMGEVYLAEDTKLKREVAIKVLPEAVRQDSEQLMRFRREAEAAAKLNHPNIAHIHTIEDVKDLTFIVMEYVEGKTLDQLIPPDGMDIDSFFNLFVPLADALVHAHNEGRIHRDLKPGNIVVTDDGIPKILDFGLARIINPDSLQAMYESDMATNSQAPTMTMKAAAQDVPSLTQGGQLIGTPMYMSPEQAEREEVDARTDIFSFGVVMYESITGCRPFEGRTLESIIGRILTETPRPVTDLKPVTPHSIWQIIRKCLRKKRDQRIQTAVELHTDLQEIQQEVQTGTVLVDASTIPSLEPVPDSSVPFWRQPVVIIVIALMTLVIGITGTWLVKPDPESPLRKFAWPIDNLRGSVISPDGTMVAYIAGNPERLWIRDLDNTTRREIPDSEGAQGPFWSPGSDYVGYFVQNELRKVSVQGGAGILICTIRTTTYADGAWNSEGTIILSLGGRIFQVSDQGGEPELWVQPDTSRGEGGFYTPLILPGEKNYIFSMGIPGGGSELVVQSEATRQKITSSRNDMLLQPHYDGSGYLLYQHGYRNINGIWAIPFDLSSLKATGDPFLVAQDAQYPSVSEDGTLVYMSAQVVETTLDQMVWVDRNGRMSDRIGQPLPGIRGPALSPDGQSVAVISGGRQNSNLWVYDVVRGSKIRLTTEDGGYNEPAWSPDGQQIAYSSNQSGLTITAANGTGTSRKVLRASGNPSWSSDGRYIVYMTRGAGTSRDLWYLSLAGDEQPVALLKTKFNEGTPQLSPDGRYLAYISDQSGQEEVYVTAFPSGEGRWPISVNGGSHPLWSPKGDELFYLEGDRLMSVPIATRPSLQAEVPRPLFTASDAGVSFQALGPYYAPLYDVHPDGDRFVMIQSAGDDKTPVTITVVQNWVKEFEGRD